MDGNNFSEDGIDLFIGILRDNYSLTDVSISELAYNDQLDDIDDILDRNFEIKKNKKNDIKKDDSKKDLDTKKEEIKKEELKKEEELKKKKEEEELKKQELDKKIKESKTKIDDNSTPPINWKSNLKTTPNTNSSSTQTTSSTSSIITPKERRMSQKIDNNNNMHGNLFLARDKITPITSSTRIEKNEHFLLKWANLVGSNYDIKVDSFTHLNWKNGKMFAVILNDHNSDLLEWPRPSEKESDIELLNLCFKIFEEDLLVEPLLDACDAGKETKTMMLYLNTLRHQLKSLQPTD